MGRDFAEALITPAHHGQVTAHAELLRLNVSPHARHDSALRRHRAPPVTVSWTSTPLRDAEGRIAHVIASGVDVSERVEAAAALRQARRQLERRVEERTRDLAAANADLQVQMAERQRLEAELIQLSEREQQRFAQELHDGLGQHLTAAAIHAELLARDLQSGAAQQAAQRIEGMLSDAVSQTRLLARGLFPVEIEDNGLMAALQQLAESTTRLARQPCTLHYPRPVELSDHTVSTHLYRIAQEAVNNAVKHAPGAPIEITLQADGEGVRLGVRNAAGRVPPRQRASEGPGIGLRIARHRAHLIDAVLESVPHAGGWQLQLHWPGPPPVQSFADKECP